MTFTKGLKDRYDDGERLLTIIAKQIAAGEEPDADLLAQVNMWGSNASSMKRIRAMLNADRMRELFGEYSILDVGCGTGTLRKHIVDEHAAGMDTGVVSYVGLDMRTAPLAYACTYNHGAALPTTYHHGTIESLVRTEVLAVKFERVVASGVFGHGWNFADAQQEMLRMWSLTSGVLSFNMLSTDRIDEDPDALYVDSSQLAAFVRSRMSPCYMLDHTYLPHDFTVHVFRPQAATLSHNTP